MLRRFALVTLVVLGLMGHAHAQLLQTFTGPDYDPYTYGFGSSVAAVGSNVLVGAPSAENGVFGPAGVAYLFDTSGTLLTRFTEPTPHRNGYFGWSVAAVGGNVLVGAPGGTGAAYLFDTSGNLLQAFTAPPPDRGDGFGSSVAAVGSDVLVGSPFAGAAYLFDTGGKLLQKFTDPTPTVGDYFGVSIAAVGGNVLIGSFSATVNGTFAAGAAYLFDTSGNLLKTFAAPTPGDSHRFGFSVAAVGGNLLISTLSDFDQPAYLFDTSGGLLETFVDPTPNSYNDLFGYSVAAVGGNVLIGSPGTEVGGCCQHLGAVYLESGVSGSFCGDTHQDPGETCDDGQDPPQSGDGCSAACQIEPGWTCSGTPSVCIPPGVCGDGHPDPLEDCDDGNKNDNDCCQNDCKWNMCGDGIPCTDPTTCGLRGPTMLEECDEGTSLASGLCTTTCEYRACVGGTRDGWAFRAEVIPGEGLVAEDVRYGPRLVARRMGLQSVTISTAGNPQVITGDLQLINTRCMHPNDMPNGINGSPDPHWPASSAGAEATYRAVLPDGKSVIIKQSYRFDAFIPDERCEATDTAQCVRFWPTITWAYGTHGVAPDGLSVEVIQRLEFDPDARGVGAATLVSDHLGVHGGHLDSVDGAHFRHEGKERAIDNGSEVYWDNWHQTSRNKVGLPGTNIFDPKPGCAECVHAHWAWNKAVNAVTLNWTDGWPEILDGSHQNAHVLFVKYNPAESKLANPYDLIDTDKKGNINSGFDRVVMYWDATSVGTSSPQTGVELNDGQAYDGVYVAGDSFWPQLNNKRHGGNGSMFLVPARLLKDSWQVIPFYGQVSHEPAALYNRLPAGYVLPVKVQYIPPPKSKSIQGGPFYLRINGNCVTDVLLNPEPAYKSAPIGPPWIVIRKDTYQPAVGKRPATFKPGVAVDNYGPNSFHMVYVVLSRRPMPGDLKFEVVAAPYGTGNYVAAVDPSVSLGESSCIP